MSARCPLCRAPGVAWEPAAAMSAELPMRERFVRRRFDHQPAEAEEMDLTRFQFGEPDDLAWCGFCGVAFRSRPGDYAGDRYDEALLSHLHPRYRAAFAARVEATSGLVPARAEVIEVGSHLGAFLEAAEQRDWRPTGYDIGHDTRRFARRRGLRVRGEPLTETRRPAASADAVMIWNCFEQLDDPWPVLRAARELLRPHGVLVVRTPNLAFYTRWRRELEGPRHREAVRRLAYNNLLGFPYRTGYTPMALARAVTRAGYEFAAGFESGLLVAPYPELPACVAAEAEAATGGRDIGPPHPEPGSLGGPWVEMAFRRRD